MLAAFHGVKSVNLQLALPLSAMGNRSFLVFTLTFGLGFVRWAVAQTAAPGDTAWKAGGFASLQVNQVAFVHWAAGGENSLSLTALGGAFVHYSQGKNYWHNTLLMHYGFHNTQYTRTTRKNVDLLEVTSKGGRQLSAHWYYSALLNARTQFAPGYIFPNDSVVVSRFFAPAFINVSLGADYKPVPFFSLYVSPVTGRLLVVANQAIANQLNNGSSIWGNDPAQYDSAGNLLRNAKQLRPELGAFLAATFDKEVLKNVTVTSKLQLFNNYTDKDPANRKNIDVLFDLLVNMKINKLLTTTFLLNLIYDHNIIIADLDENGQPTGRAGPRTQIKENFGVGLSYRFGDAMKN